MSVRRTKQQKQRAQERRSEALEYSFHPQGGGVKKSGEGAASLLQTKSFQLFPYDTNLIYKDLCKTVVLTLLIVGALIAIAVYLAR